VLFSWNRLAAHRVPAEREPHDPARFQEANMGLLDILHGMQNGPHDQRHPSSSGRGGGMSSIMMALLGLLAYKALKGSGGATPGGTGRPASPSVNASDLGDGLHDVLSELQAKWRSGASLAEMIRGGLGGLLGGAAAGNVLSDGLGNLIKEFQQSGHGRTAQSWVSTGPNQEIAPNDLANALGNDTLDALSQKTGLGREDLLIGLRQHLPDLIDKLTPHGRLPTHEEASRMV
jgi:uncharacterized protein YidB (DUF937 family)